MVKNICRHFRITGCNNEYVFTVRSPAASHTNPIDFWFSIREIFCRHHYRKERFPLTICWTVNCININKFLARGLFSAGIAPGSNQTFRNESCRLTTLDADPPGHFLVFGNDLAMNPFCAALRIPAKLTVFLLDLQYLI